MTYLNTSPKTDGEKKFQSYLRSKGYTPLKDEEEISLPSEEDSSASADLPEAPAADRESDDRESTSVGGGGTQKAFSYEAFSHPDYVESESVTNAAQALNDHLAAKPGDYESQWQSELDTLMAEIMNREAFSYNMEEDALYQQYKDQYVRQGRLAMEDTVGKASAMTGGYGNSWAQSVGAQQYGEYLQRLSELTPELYGMALERYVSEGEALEARYGILSEQEALDYDRYRESLSDYLKETEYLTERYEDERKADYDRYAESKDLAYRQYEDERALAYKEHSADREAAYQAYRDSVADGKWERELAEDQRQFDEKLKFQKQQYEDKQSEEAQDPTKKPFEVFGSGEITEALSVSPKAESAEKPSLSEKSEADSAMPDNIGGMKLTDAGFLANVNGEMQPVQKAGEQYWVWRGDLGRFVRLSSVGTL